MNLYTNLNDAINAMWELYAETGQQHMVLQMPDGMMKVRGTNGRQPKRGSVMCATKRGGVVR